MCANRRLTNLKKQGPSPNDRLTNLKKQGRAKAEGLPRGTSERGEHQAKSSRLAGLSLNEGGPPAAHGVGGAFSSQASSKQATTNPDRHSVSRPRTLQGEKRGRQEPPLRAS